MNEVEITVFVIIVFMGIILSLIWVSEYVHNKKQGGAKE